jgi:Tfp pilus assembly PilM family ATPase
MELRGVLAAWRDALARVSAPTLLMELQDQRLLIQPLKGGTELDIPLPKGFCQAGLPAQVVALGDFIGDLLVEQGWVKVGVVAALPLEGAVLRVVEAPQSATAEALREQLKEEESVLGLPFALDQADLDLQVLDPQRGKWLLVAAHQQVVEAWLRVFDQAGVELQRLAPVQLTWMAMAEASRPTGLLLVLRVEAACCQVFAVIDQEPVYCDVLEGPARTWVQQAVQVVRGLVDQQLLAPSAPWLVASELPTQGLQRLADELGAQLELMCVPDPYTSVVLAGLARLA